MFFGCSGPQSYGKNKPPTGPLTPFLGIVFDLLFQFFHLLFDEKKIKEQAYENDHDSANDHVDLTVRPHGIGHFGFILRERRCPEER
jgi:hypothetical protein